MLSIFHWLRISAVYYSANTHDTDDFGGVGSVNYCLFARGGISNWLGSWHYGNGWINSATSISWINGCWCWLHWYGIGIYKKSLEPLQNEDEAIKCPLDPVNRVQIQEDKVIGCSVCKCHPDVDLLHQVGNEHSCCFGVERDKRPFILGIYRIVWEVMAINVNHKHV